MPYLEDVSSRWFSSSCSFPASPSKSSANLGFAIVCPTMLTVPVWFSKASVIICSRMTLNKVGNSHWQSLRYGTILPPCLGQVMHWWLLLTVPWWSGWTFVPCYTSSLWPIVRHTIPGRTPPWNQWRCGICPADAGCTSHTEFAGWISVLWCFCLGKNLPVLWQWSFMPVISACSRWLSALLYWHNLWDWLFDRSVVVDCLWSTFQNFWPGLYLLNQGE